MKKITLIFFLLQGLLSNAQSWLPIQQDTLLEKRHELIFSGTADYASTSLHKSLTQKLFYGGEITDEIKDKSLKLHRGINQFGSDLNAEIEYRNFQVNLFGKSTWGFTVKAGYYSFINALYSKDLFKLGFYGNDSFIGSAASISGTQFAAYGYQKIGFGWLDKKSKSSVSLNIYNLSNYSDALVRTGEIFQSQTIDSLSIAFDGRASFTNDTSFFKGFGAGLDADIRLTVPTKNNNVVYYQFLAKNVGFTSLRESMNRYSGDTVFTFTGLTLNQALNGGSFLDSNFSVLDTLGVQQSQAKTTVFLPGFLQFSKLVDANSTRKLQEFYGIRLFLSSIYNPLVFAGLDYRIHLGNANTLNVGLNACYGGFSKFRFGLYSSLRIKNWNLGLASENIIGKTGQSILIRIQCAY
jgi:hypothetical protein